MSWVDDMKQDAAKTAFPDYTLTGDDEVILNVSWAEGYSYSSYTFEDPSFSITVEVVDKTTKVVRTAGNYYLVYFASNDEAQGFMTRLMDQASQH